MSDETLEIVLVVSAAADLLCAVFAGHIASRKGLSAAGYFLLGLLLGLLGLAVALIARPAAYPAGTGSHARN